ncbi:hypothetical protein [Arthrobacter sp. NicSoilB11]|uniref:hypothetical protein n=1 Tax=Arthrobacter sp. NicSoilB11 TaxID=2830999 RepID=UPI001CC79298|nr:hypothetical protein [Arthrobacter sp. NicSoilB11]BCW76264.1 hypothetical protein NicSoilB11_25890 [Arthrobacter sp. NicSoilB11]
MGQPGFPSPRGEDYIVREIADLKRSLRELAAANPFGLSGVRLQNGGMTLDGTLGVTGTSTINGPQNVNGALTVTGSVDLPAGSVSDTALANPVQTATASNGVTNYAIDTTSTVRASVTLTVPAGGFTRAIVIANATAMGTNSGTAGDYLYVSAVVAGVNGGELYSSAAPGLGVGLSAPFNPTLTGLTSGQTITVSVATRAGTATWAAATANQASIAATAIFLK